MILSAPVGLFDTRSALQNRRWRKTEFVPIDKGKLWRTFAIGYFVWRVVFF
jgi:hypothetical protein